MTSGMRIQEGARPASPVVMKRRVLPTTGGGAASPPPTLPLSHFAFALLWLAVASVMLPWVAPQLARGNVFEPAVVALVHVLVLGTVGSAIAGALQQFASQAKLRESNTQPLTSTITSGVQSSKTCLRRVHIDCRKLSGQNRPTRRWCQPPGLSCRPCFP